MPSPFLRRRRRQGSKTAQRRADGASFTAVATQNIHEHWFDADEVRDQFHSLGSTRDTIVGFAPSS